MNSENKIPNSPPQNKPENEPVKRKRLIINGPKSPSYLLMTGVIKENTTKEYVLEDIKSHMSRTYNCDITFYNCPEDQEVNTTHLYPENGKAAPYEYVVMVKRKRNRYSMGEYKEGKEEGIYTAEERIMRENPKKKKPKEDEEEIVMFETEEDLYEKLKERISCIPNIEEFRTVFNALEGLDKKYQQYWIELYRKKVVETNCQDDNSLMKELKLKENKIRK
jgi:hypothetical protein